MAKSSKLGPNTEPLKRVRLTGGAPVTEIGDLASHSHKLGKGKTRETKTKGAGLTAPMVAPGNPRSGGPTTQVFGKTMGNAKTKGGH